MDERGYVGTNLMQTENKKIVEPATFCTKQEIRNAALLYRRGNYEDSMSFSVGNIASAGISNPARVLPLASRQTIWPNKQQVQRSREF